MRFFLSLIFFYYSVMAVEIMPYKIYDENTKLTASSLGISLGVPKHWKAKVQEDKRLLLFQEETDNTISLEAKTMTIKEGLNYLLNDHYLQDDTKIYGFNTPTKINSRIYRRSYRLSANTTQQVMLYVISDTKDRLVIMSVRYDRADESKIEASTLSLAQGISFTPNQQLKNRMSNVEMRLKGGHFVYMKREGAFDDKREIWLCSNKRFGLNIERTVAGAMSKVKNIQYGSWSVEHQRLILKADDGFIREIKINIESNTLFFDQARSYVLQNNQCR